MTGFYQVAEGGFFFDYHRVLDDVGGCDNFIYEFGEVCVAAYYVEFALVFEVGA